MKHSTPVGIWGFIGIIFILYGILIGGAGVYYIFHPPVGYKLSYLNPSLWWGILMFLVGLIFYLINKPPKREGDGII